MTLAIGALLGLIAVAFGAYAEHGLKESITDVQFGYLMTAIRYNQVHALVISAIGLSLLHNGKLSNIPALKWSGLLFSIGTILFSFSIYFSVLFAMPSLLSLTPIGGITIMLAWAMLLIVGLLARKRL